MSISHLLTTDLLEPDSRNRINTMIDQLNQISIAAAKTLTVSNTLTLAGNDGSSVAFGAGGTVAYTSGTLAQFAVTTSAQLAGIISDETGSGSLVFATSPTLVTPNIGAATGTTLALGANPASAGAIRLSADTKILSRNNANNGDINLINLDGSNNVVVGSASAPATYLDAGGTTGFIFRVGSTQVMNIISGGFVGVGAPFTPGRLLEVRVPTLSASITDTHFGVSDGTNTTMALRMSTTLAQWTSNVAIALSANNSATAQLYITSGGLVGVGTTTPLAGTKLHVKGANETVFLVETSVNNPGVLFFNGNGGGDYSYFLVNTTVSGGGYYFRNGGASGQNTTLMQVMNSGLVGIGIIPIAQLHVLGSYNSGSDLGTALFESQDAGATGMVFDYYHNTASPAISDIVGQWRVWGRNAAATKVQYGNITVTATAVINNSAKMTLAVASGGGGLTGTLILTDDGVVQPSGGYKSTDGSAGATTTITTGSLVGKTITVKNGLITSFA